MNNILKKVDIERVQSLLNEAIEKPKMRIVHHLACSGGTIIAKSISAMPNVYLLSEVHPFCDLGLNCDKPTYRPTDFVALARYAKIPRVDELAAEIFKSNARLVSNHLIKIGANLVIRDHSHVDYCVRDEVPTKSKVVDILKEDFEILGIVTVRDPVDAYLALIKNNWLHFEPKTFDEYCKRYLCFVGQFASNQVFKYENFVENPSEELKKMMQHLDLPFNDSFHDIISLFNVTGDSGRSGSVISKRQRREISQSLEKEIKESENYIRLIDELGYTSV